ncbi:lytic transglycosylase [Sphingomonas sp. Leaf24]|uniref:lytic transglycosylase domain-containing protein n=1 Tax=unclassified Sphingomonas TaxID=196159 RepID=UPI0006F57748|nr:MULTISPECIES: lytic transglycosylase domain-containing protein [unclassified Sphingomonas]KQM12955.1 lytic transglycosylase [Sphingomonas sp. Leaf5]KQM89530.1 lytic transglycosylase [Sphingomonas sp. Leaf24]
MLPALPAYAGEAPTLASVARTPVDARVPPQLSPEDRDAYTQVFAAIRAGRWADAQLRLDAMKPGPLHAVARAELYTAKGSPKVELPQLLALLTEAPDLPHAPDLARLAKLRGADAVPELPTQQKLVWFDAAPVRLRAKAARSDAAAAQLLDAMKPFVKVDDGAAAEALIATRESDLTPEALTEMRGRVAWIYFVAGDDANARRLAAVAQRGSGDWAAQADWTQGLAAWRQQDCAAAQTAFASVAQRAGDTELRSAGLYWATRADIACGRPDLVQGRLQTAAQYGETYYGLLARQALGLIDGADAAARAPATDDWRALERRSNVKVAAALTEIGEGALADKLLRYQARIGGAGDYPALTRLCGSLNLPATQLWLSHNGPQGARPLVEARYPAPDWTPEGGWRVDKALVFAHTLQESRFDAGVVSPAGATGLMQIRPGALTDYARAHGLQLEKSALSKPQVNMAVGQSYLEQLRDRPFTGGLLPKVIAAYNAGPTPVEAWNVQLRDGGDPLMYIESIPYWETRGYVMTVLRNYWMYEKQAGKPSASRAALAQGMWPKFPGLPGATAIRVSKTGRTRVADAN